MNGQPEQSSDEKVNGRNIERIADERREVIADKEIDSILQKMVEVEPDCRSNKGAVEQEAKDRQAFKPLPWETEAEARLRSDQARLLSQSKDRHRTIGR